MCGICGFVSEKYIDLKKMVHSIKHRGPDYLGEY
jgi:asparagine synthetase B (glutamine-hydrolysing)